MCTLSLFVSLVLLLSKVGAMTTQGSFAMAQILLDFRYTVTTASLYINFELYLSPFYSAALLIGRNVPFNVSTQREDWIHFDHLQAVDCDYQGMVTGQKQYGWAASKGIGSHIEFKLINFEPFQPFSYIVNITESNRLLKSCPVGLIRVSGEQYCQFCDEPHIGAYCDIKRIQLDRFSQSQLKLPAFSYTYFALKTQTDIKLSASFDDGIHMYFQTQASQEELAGIVNYFPSSLAQGMYIFGFGQLVSIEFKTTSNLLLGIINPNPNTVNITLGFTEKSEINVLVIVIAVVGGVFFLGLMIVAFVVLKRINNHRREVLPEGHLLRKRPMKLSRDEIEAYFPALAFEAVCPHLELYGEPKQESMENPQTECIICLCSIDKEELTRVGYCKHIFHAHCLSEWFKKQQNCPYCRCDYTRQSTASLYNTLVKRIGKRLKGIQIVRSLFHRSEELSINTINFTELGGTE